VWYCKSLPLNRAVVRPQIPLPQMARPPRAASAAGAAALFLASAVLAACAAPAAAGCGQGDLQCACREAGGYWETPPAPLMPTCKVKIWHQGRER
jgi:hypothetical protein